MAPIACTAKCLARRFHGRRARSAVDRRPAAERSRRSHRPRAAAAVYQARRCGRPIAIATRRSTRSTAARLPHRPRDCTSRRSCSRRSTPAASNARRSRCTSATAPSSRFAPSRSTSIGWRTSTTTVSPDAAAAITRAHARRPSHHRRWHDDDTNARVRWPSTLTAAVAAGAGATSLFITPGHTFRLVSRTDHQLPSAALVAAAAGQRLRRAGTRARGLPACGRASATGSTVMATPC